MRSQIENRKSKIAVGGAGPAGSSLAIRLAKKGLAVTLIEKDKFPREKLCGEFISPECFRHFEELDVQADLFAKGGDHISETRFFDRSGRFVSVPTSWFESDRRALSLSRAEMDLQLMLAAKRCGVEVIEEARVIAADIHGDVVRNVTLRLDDGSKREMAADIFVDATGRAAALSRLTVNAPATNRRSAIVGFKAHLQNVLPEEGVCEIYFFDGGYGGLSHVQDGKANFCFLVKADLAKRFNGQTNRLFEWILDQNRRAGERLSAATPVHDWLAVAIDDFGRKPPLTASNLVAVGDAGAFIDPFTGSGILMALESSELLASQITANGFERATYLAAYRRAFRRRLAVASILRRAAFMPKAASVAIRLASASERLRQIAARATRSGGAVLREE